MTKTSVPRDRVAVITDCDHDDIEFERRIFADTPFSLELHQCRTAEQVLEMAADAEVVVTQYAPLDARVLEGLPACRTIVRYGVGVDNIDVEAATGLGIQIVNVPDYGVAEVADHALALLLALARGIDQLVPGVLDGDWTYEPAIPLQRLEGMTVGVVGCGRIGGQLVRRLRALGLTVLVHDTGPPNCDLDDPGVRWVEFDELLEASDAISLHVPLTASTRHLIDRDSLQRLRRGALLINTARGGLVDSWALLAALESGQVGAAGLDVLEEEPPAPDHPLVAHPRTLITPHSAWYSEQAYAALKSEVANEALRALRHEAPRCPVNRPLNPRKAPTRLS